MGGVGGVAAVAASGADDADGRLLGHHGPDLDVGGLGAEEEGGGVEIVAVLEVEVELVLGGARGVVGGGVEGVEVVPDGVDVGAVGDDEAHAAEDGDGGVHDEGDGVLVSESALASGKGDVEGAVGLGLALEAAGGGLEGVLEFLLDGVEGLADGGSVGGGDGAEA